MKKPRAAYWNLYKRDYRKGLRRRDPLASLTARISQALAKAVTQGIADALYPNGGK